MSQVFALPDADETARDVAKRWGDLARDEVAKRTPVAEPREDMDDIGREPGRLREGWKVEVHRGLRGYTADIVNDVSYAVFVERGTRAHIIRARNGKALRFRVEGGVRFAKEVHHPGTTGVFMLLRGMEAARPRLREAGAEPLRGLKAKWRRHIRVTGQIKDARSR